MLIDEALRRGRARLACAHAENPALDAGLLLSHVLGVSREKLYAGIPAGGQSREGAPGELSPEDFSRFFTCVERRACGECTAYITGRREFYGLDFCVNPAVLVPRPDTETLVEAALEEISRRAPGAGISRHSLLDLCTGSGAVAVAVKHENPELEVWAADISEEALKTARLNAERLLPKTGNGGRAVGAAGTAVRPEIRFCRGDLFDALDTADTTPPVFSVICANAPYVPSGDIGGLPKEVQNEPKIALDGGEDGLEIIRRIIEKAPGYLDGVLLLEADPSQMDDIAFMLKERGFSGIYTRKDLSGGGRVIAGRFSPGRSP
ncbi:MAG: peptide chain release factor N(5)-glutamine methyltransferase [Treponema sp.]|jgi:release factor glutamine methyltransferase|nr:peptide chain release factor N(5)-glutamine methyltransferase [Treponema sp.]